MSKKLYEHIVSTNYRDVATKIKNVRKPKNNKNKRGL